MVTCDPAQAGVPEIPLMTMLCAFADPAFIMNAEMISSKPIPVRRSFKVHAGGKNVFIFFLLWQ